MSEIKKYVLTRGILALVIALIIEICVFNYQSFWASDINHREIDLASCGAVSEYIEDNGDECMTLLAKEDGSCGIYFSEDCAINNIRIRAHGADSTVPIINSNNEPKYDLSTYPLGLKILGIKEGNSDIYTLYDGVICDSGDGIIYNLPGNDKYQYLYIELESYAYMPVYIEGVEINVIPNICFSFIRFFGALLILLVICFWKYIKKFFSQECSLYYAIGVASICGLLFCAGSFVNPVSRTSNVSIDSYNDLARALLQGKVTVHDEYAYSLDSLSNVYDHEERNSSGIFYLFDYAYYEGHYYVYFGVVPCVLLYLPYMLLTGKDLINSAAMAVFVLGLCIGIGKLLYEIVDRYFEKTTRGQFIFLYCLIVFMAQIPFLISFPVVYQIVQCAGLMFAVWGLAFYVKGGNEKAPRFEKVHIALGSLMLALSVGCRPQYGLLAILALPLLMNKMIKSKNNIVLKWISFMGPYIIVAIPLMLYNYIRFNSVFDFGSTYNLTNDNIYEITISIQKMTAGFRYMFMESLRFTNRFPYLDTWIPIYSIDRQVKWTTGGIFILNALSFIAFIPVSRKCKEHIEVLLMQYAFVFCSLFLGVFATVLNGCIERYKIDCSIWIGIATALVCISLLNKYKSRIIRILLGIGLIQIVLSSCILYFYSDIMTMVELNKPLFQEIEKVIAFWT